LRKRSAEPHGQTKICKTCGRSFSYRKKWKNVWSEVLYCSKRCGGEKNLTDYGPALLSLLQARGRSKTICPSEVLSEDEKQDQQIMELVRRSARRLVSEGQIEILQDGKVVDPDLFRGPIRLRLRVEK
jgi:hypothetical protein